MQTMKVWHAILNAKGTPVEEGAEARRLCKQGKVRIAGKCIKNHSLPVECGSALTLGNAKGIYFKATVPYPVEEKAKV